MADEQEQQGSQSPSPASDDAAGGTNSVENQPVSQEPREAERNRDYYNKTQDVASQRRSVEDDRLRLERERAEYAHSTGQQYPGINPPGGYQAPQYPAQQYPQGYGQQQVGPIAPQQADFSPLVDQFGYDGARTIVGVVQQLAQPLLQQNLITQQELNRQQITALETQISLKGKKLYGDAWDKHESEVFNVIRNYNGLPLEMAWNAVTGGASKQAGVDQAYQNMGRKQSGNAVTQSTAPAREMQPAINSFADAFKAAAKQHNG